MTLKDLTDSLGIVPRRVCEIATGHPANTYMLEYMEAGIPTLLIEPQRALYEEIMAHFGTRPNVEVLQKLITEDGRYRRMVRPMVTNDAVQASFVEGVYAPIVHYSPKDVVSSASGDWCMGADCCTMLMIDPGDIDVLNLDAEGSEWTVLSTMVSRPKLIHVEVYGAYGYVNPDLHKIETWAAFNGYREMECPDLKDAGQNKVYVRDV